MINEEDRFRTLGYLAQQESCHLGYVQVSIFCFNP
jgi:hypothetical protein